MLTIGFVMVKSKFCIPIVSMKDGELSEMKIEKNVPIPKMGRGDWDFLENMEIGDSIFFETKTAAMRCRDAMRYRKMGYRTSKVGGGYRVWYKPISENL